MRIVLGVTGASGSIFAVEFLRRVSEEETYLILSRWGRSVLHQETGLTAENLANFAKKIFSNDDLNSPLASGSNPFDAFVILPCSVTTLGKIAHGIGDNLITRCAAVALKERRKLIICVRETPLSTIDLENAHKLSMAGAIIMPVSPPFYQKPQSLPDLINGFVDKVRGSIGLPVDAGWRAKEL
ncbi:MAG: UbiX family flavin prenyltransferase [Elusimicrobia bacterium]|jgi:4-hydroxy-3-polyprenylbenzoate decarboxylase|nr:UbiX family flavin prenyltransferase [Elusimicrobiota bacterium]